MTTGTVTTQGTKLYFIDAVTQTNTEIVKMACPTGITGVGGGARDQLDDSCLDTIGDKTVKPGLGNPNTMTIPFNLVPRDYSHPALFELKELGTVLHWMVVLSDNEDDPNNVSFTPAIGGDEEFTVPADRSSVTFDAFISEVNLDFASNEIVRGTLTLQRSGSLVFTAYTPA